MRTRTPAWQLPLFTASTTVADLLDTELDDDDVIHDLCVIYDNVLRLERILYEEKTHGV